jgi:endonuclease/exonuclease/phosphatase (EEP) superfamily protein YafD
VPAANVTRNRPGPVRIAAYAVAGLALLVALLGLVAHFWTPTQPVTIAISALTPYLMLGAPLALLVAALARHRAGMAVAAVLTLLCVATQVSIYQGGTPAPPGELVKTMTVNLKRGEADPAAVVRAVRTHRIILLMTQELTDAEQAALVGAGLQNLLPYHATHPAPGPAGLGIWSKWPLYDMQVYDSFRFPMVTADLGIPGWQAPAVAIAFHPPGPWPDSSTNWVRDMNRLHQFLPTLPKDQVVIVGGDFNATADITQFRRLLTDGYRDAAEQGGAGLAPTYPSDAWYPPLFTIDHIVTRNAKGRHVYAVQIRGSDHRALVATVVLG